MGQTVQESKGGITYELIFDHAEIVAQMNNLGFQSGTVPADQSFEVVVRKGGYETETMNPRLFKEGGKLVIRFRVGGEVSTSETWEPF